jgi:hypothetical protein
MMLTLLWKEFREHRSIWLTMVVMTGLLAVGITQLPGMQDPSGQVGLAVLAMAAVYGVVCGAMMFAGEREGGTLVFLDIFLGRRDFLWVGKFLIGALFVVTEAVAVALILRWANQAPPTWLPAVMGQGGGQIVELRPDVTLTPGLWFIVLIFVTVEGYCWGLLGSIMTQRVLTSAGVALLMGFPIWWFTVLFPAPASLFVRILVMLGLLSTSFFKFLWEARDTVMAPPPVFADPKAAVLRELEHELEYGRSRPRSSRPADEGWGEPVPVTLAPESYSVNLDDRPPPRRRFSRPDQARSPREVLLWLTFGQAAVPLTVLGIASALLGLFIPAFGQTLWPMATLLLGVACGAATFAFEQSDLSYQFLAAQHFPLKTIWNVKIGFWAIAAVLSTLLLLGTGGFLVLIGMAHPNPQNADLPIHFRFGTLQQLMGPVLFFGVWLVYGFCVGQVFVLLCRKPIYAVMIAAIVSLGAIGLWLPAVFCRGMSGWQLWLTPIAAIVATRILVRAWAAGRIKERRPMAALIGFSLAAVAWLAVQMGWRAWEVLDVGEPLDRATFRASIPGGKENAAGLKIQEAIGHFETRDGKDADWLARMAEIVELPPGVIEVPSSEGSAGLMRHIESCQRMAATLATRARGAQTGGKHEAALDYLAQVLALSRSLRNKAPIRSYAAGIDVEAMALAGVDEMLQRERPSPKLLQQIRTVLDRHAEATPAPLDCLQTECYRAGGLLERPTGWSFYTGLVPERPLAGGIALSLETPWERERAARIWRLVWAGHFRALQTPHWQLPEVAADLDKGILKGWLPAAQGREATVGPGQVNRYLEASWLDDPQLYCHVHHLHAAANRARWQLAASRLSVALVSYQLREGKPAAKLADLVPRDLPEVPVDPYTGQEFLYRVSEGERLTIIDGVTGMPLVNQGLAVLAGEGIVWSTGPDRTDDGGRRLGNRVRFENPVWNRPGFDLITKVPRWR